MQMIITFSILGISILLFMGNKIRADLVSLFALLSLILFGILTPGEALAGFSNTVVIMIAGLFVVSAGIFRTGLANQAGSLLLRVAGRNEAKLLTYILIIVAIIGAFMSNTGTVALMLPVIVGIAVTIKVTPAKFLIPLAYMSSLSGLLTLIATPPNLIVSQVLVDNGFDRLGFFEITPIGVIAVITGIIYLVAVRNILLPKDDKQNQMENGYKLSPKKIIADYQLADNLHRVRVTEDSSMIGKKLADLKIPANYQLCILEISRKSQDGKSLFPMNYREMAGPMSEIEAKDTLYIQGSRVKVEELVNDFGLVFKEENSEENELISKQLGIAEVLLTPQSRLINQTISEIGFREKYNLNMIGINRKGTYLMKNMSKERLRFGDALLVQGSWDEIEFLSRETNDVVVIGQPTEHASMAAANGKAPIAATIMLLMIFVMIFEVVPPVVSVLVAAVLMVVTGCLRNMDDAYGNINWESIVLIAAMLPLATALEKTGGMVILSEGIIQVLGDYGVIGVFAGIYFLTMLFGQFISNTATAVLFAPIAMNAAITMGANPVPFLIAVTVAATMGFSTPVASPTNALVMTAGGYKFNDFVKIGVPLQIIMFVVMVIAIPLVFPF